MIVEEDDIDNFDTIEYVTWIQLFCSLEKNALQVYLL